MVALRGVIIRSGIASLPLLAVIALCLAMFSGLGRHKGTMPALNLPAPLMPAANAATVNTGKTPVIQAAFERLHITRATIRVPD